MPKGELYIKTTQTESPAGALDTNVTDGWVDAYETWGVSLEAGALSRLMTPAPKKDPVTNKNVISNGVSIVQSQFYWDVRSVSLEMHITAPDRTAFIERYEQFCEEVLAPGILHIKTTYQPNRVYNMRYVDCEQFSQFHLQVAKFTLSLEEPRPDITTYSE